MPSVQSSYLEASGWHTRQAIRLDLVKLSELVRHETMSPSSPELSSPPPPSWPAWKIEKTSQEIIFVKDRTCPIGIFWQSDQPFLTIDPVHVAFSSSFPAESLPPTTARPHRYTTGNTDNLLKLARRGSVRLLPPALPDPQSSGAFAQSFMDVSMSDQDWSDLGFIPPSLPRPALDIHGVSKNLQKDFICIPYGDLESVEKSCLGLWDNYVDSSREGVYFSKLQVSSVVWTGLTAGMSPGSTVVMSRDFAAGMPYRPAWLSVALNPCPPPPPRTHSVVFHRSGQYVSLDPSLETTSPEITVRWKALAGWESAVFASPGRYIPARELRRTHYVPPRAKTKMVWERGRPQHFAEKCLLSPSAGGRYTPRPSRQKYRELVEKYGRSSVPRNFDKYSEPQIARKSRLQGLVATGEWVFLPSGQEPSPLIAAGYARLGIKPLPWRSLRQIQVPGEVEVDPFGAGMYARLVPRQEVFRSKERMRKLARMMKVDGWDFVLEEVIAPDSELKKAVFSMVLG